MPSLTGFLQTVRSREEACQVSARWCLVPQKQIDIEGFTDHHIPLFPHPPSLPDLNPIEPIWHELKTIIHCLPHPPTTFDTLKSAVLAAWEEIPIEKINHQIGKMEKRVKAVLTAHGGHTPF